MKSLNKNIVATIALASVLAPTPAILIVLR